MKKLILTALILLLFITNVQAVTLTQRLGNEEVKMTVTAGEVVSLKFNSKLGYQFKNWTVESGSVSIPTTSANISFVMPNSNLTIRGVYDSQYTITYNANGGTGSMASQTITAGEEVTLSVQTFTNGTSTFEGWAESAGGEVKYTDGQSITPTQNLTLYAVWAEAAAARLADVVAVGDYISYTPVAKTVDVSTLTGISQTNYNTADTTEWRVLSVDEDTGVVEIVSADTVGTLALSEESYRETDGTFSAGSEEIMTQAQSNYANAIYILNEISRQYATGVGTGRGLGYNGTSVEKIDTNTYEITHAATGGNADFVNGEPYTDAYLMANNYTIADVDILTANSMMHSSGYVWLASRSMDTNSSHSYFFVVCVGASGSISYGYLFNETSAGNARSDSYALGVRPVVSLNSDISYAAVGTEGNSWEIIY